jgi:hypothetical protein
MTMTIVSRTQFQTDTDTLYPDNTTGEISPADLRAQMDNIADSAVFRGIGFAAAPTANDDSSGNNGNGEFNIGDVWIDETNDNAYVCLDDTDLAAVWALIGGGLSVTSQTGTAVAGQIATWASAAEIRGDAELTWNGSNRLIIASPDPVLELQDNDAAVDNQRWLTWVDATTLKFQAFTDAGVGGDDYVQFTRTGNVVDSIGFIAGGSLATSIAGNSLEFTGAASTVQTTDAETLSLGTNGTDALIINGTTQDITVTNNIIIGGTVDGRDLTADGTKLDTLNKHMPIESEASTTYVSVVADTGKWKRMTSGSPITVTINDSVFSAEDEITFEQAGAGTVTFAEGSGFNIRSRGGALSTAGQYAVASLKFISSSEAILIGDIA